MTGGSVLHVSRFSVLLDGRKFNSVDSPELKTEIADAREQESKWLVAAGKEPTNRLRVMATTESTWGDIAEIASLATETGYVGLRLFFEGDPSKRTLTPPSLHPRHADAVEGMRAPGKPASPTSEPAHNKLETCPNMVSLLARVGEADMPDKYLMLVDEAAGAIAACDCNVDEVKSYYWYSLFAVYGEGRDYFYRDVNLAEGGTPLEADAKQTWQQMHEKVLAVGDSPVRFTALGATKGKMHGTWTKSALRESIRTRLPSIRLCYEKELLAEPKLEGTVVMKFAITQQGRAEDITATGLGNRDVETCLVSVFETIVFLEGYIPTTVRYPLTLSSAGEDDTGPRPGGPGWGYGMGGE
ncbi:MAG: AgmX/PglI C-terminal domain-containing protein [Myxococcales bacterium]|nr:AgmX/PglI C-terminal domain-containing protein [Myxococcales bacterium]